MEIEKMRRIEFYENLRYKRIIQSWPECQTSSRVNKEKKTCYLVEFAIPVDDIVKMKESEKINIYLDLTNKLKKEFVADEGESNVNNSWRCKDSS